MCLVYNTLVSGPSLLDRLFPGVCVSDAKETGVLSTNTAPTVPLVNTNALNAAVPIPAPLTSISSDVPATRAEVLRRGLRRRRGCSYIRRRRCRWQLSKPIAQRLLRAESSAYVRSLPLLRGGNLRCMGLCGLRTWRAWRRWNERLRRDVRRVRAL